MGIFPGTRIESTALITCPACPGHSEARRDLRKSVRAERFTERHSRLPVVFSPVAAGSRPPPSKQPARTHPLLRAAHHQCGAVPHASMPGIHPTTAGCVFVLAFKSSCACPHLPSSLPCPHPSPPLLPPSSMYCYSQYTSPSRAPDLSSDSAK